MSAILFDIQRTDDTEWLNRLREDVEASECYSEADKAEICEAINLRFSQLNLLALEKNQSQQEQTEKTENEGNL